MRKAREGAKGQVFLAPLSLARPSGNLGTNAKRRPAVSCRPMPPSPTCSTRSWPTPTSWPTLAAAWELKALQPQAIVATLDGTLVNRAGLLQAGKTSDASLAVLTRRNERRALEEELASASAAAEQAASQAAEAASALQSAQAALQEAQAAAKDAEIRAATLRHTQQTLQQSVAELDASHQRAAQEAGRVASQAEADQQRQRNLETRSGKARGRSPDWKTAWSRSRTK